MKKFLSLFVLLLMPVVGVWAATVTDLYDYGNNKVGEISIEGTSAVITFTVTDVSALANTNDINNLVSSLTDVKVVGVLPSNVADMFNNGGWGFQNCQRMDFSETTAGTPTSVQQNNSVKAIILPSGSSLTSITTQGGPQGIEYIIVANSGDAEGSELEVYVKKDNSTSWASDPYVEDASYINVYKVEPNGNTSYLESDEVTALQQTKIVNGDGTIVTVEDLTIDADTEDEETVLSDFLDSGKLIKNLTVTGELADLTLFDDVDVMKNVDFSGITNSDLSTLKLPNTTGTISLPGGSYKDGIVTLSSDYTEAQLTNILAALENSGLNVNSIVFPGGSTFNTSTNALQVSKADEDAGNLSTIANQLRTEGYTIDSVKLEKYGTSWSDNKMTLASTYSAQEVSQKALLENAGFTVTSTKVTNFPDIEITVDDDGVVTITSYREGALDELFKPDYNNDPEAQAYKQLLNDNQGAGSELVLVGPFKGPDLDKLKEKNYNSYETVDMRNATFSNANDAKFTYFNASTLKTAYMSNDPGVTTITEQCLQNMNALEELHIGGSVTSIPANRVPNSIKKVYSSNSVTEIEDNAFLNHTNLELFDFGSDPHVTRIGEDAFNSTALTGNLIIPNSVERIELRAFKGVSGISAITIQEDSQLDYIGNEAFRMDNNFNLKNVYVYAEKEIECHENAWDFYATDGQTQMATVRTRLHYPPSMYYWYVGDWKSQVNGGRIEGHEDLLNLRNAVDYGSITLGDGDDAVTVTVTPKGQIGWQKFISTGIPVTADTEWRTYSDIVNLKVPEDAEEDVDKVADVYIVCDYVNGEAVLKQMTPGDIIPAGTGLVIRHYITDTQYGGLLMFPHLTAEEEAALTPEQKLPYRFVIDGDKRGSAGNNADGWNTEEWKDSPYVNIQTRDYTPTGESTSYHNYLEAIYTHGEKRAIYNAENGYYVDYNTLVMARKSGQTVTYRNFFFGNGVKLKEAMQAGSIVKGEDFDYDTDGTREWGFFRCISDMYGISSKAFLHYPASIFTANHGGSMLASDGTSQINAKEMGMFLIGYDSFGNGSGIATGINDVMSNQTIEEGYYTIQGVKVSAPVQNGIYIHNGKKVVVK